MHSIPSRVPHRLADDMPANLIASPLSPLYMGLWAGSQPRSGIALAFLPLQPCQVLVARRKRIFQFLATLWQFIIHFAATPLQTTLILHETGVFGGLRYTSSKIVSTICLQHPQNNARSRLLAVVPLVWSSPFKENHFVRPANASQANLL